MINYKFLDNFLNHRDEIILLEGTRLVSAADYLKLVDIGRLMAKLLPSCTFRSGNAGGSDEAFIKGVGEIRPEAIELFIPFKNHRKKSISTRAKVLSLDDLSSEEIDNLKRISAGANPARASLVQLYQQGNTSLLSNKAAFLLRDVLKVTGFTEYDFRPTQTAVFYVNEYDPLSGGTGHTLKTCNYFSIKTYTQADYLKK